MSAVTEKASNSAIEKSLSSRAVSGASAANSGRDNAASKLDLKLGCVPTR
jgi:hypothetical protein